MVQSLPMAYSWGISVKPNERNLHDITSPEEMAEVLKIVEPGVPLTDVGRRREVAARNGNAEDVRFWDEVIEILAGGKNTPEQLSCRQMLH